jgi:methionine aminotransferase
MTARMPEIPSKLPGVGTTIFTVMSQLAAECGAINLSQGFPDFPVPAAHLGMVVRSLREGSNQYAPMAGLPALRAAIARKTMALYGRSVDPDAEITVTSGATEALFCAIQACVGPGEEVIVFDPAYDSYEPAVRLAGGRAVHIALQAPAFSVDWDQVRDSVTDRTRVIVVNSPHNPTGMVLGPADLAALAEVIEDRPIVLVADEVYEHIIFDGRQHESLLRYPLLAERSIVVSSFGKTCHATGWKVGYCIAPRDLMREFRKIHQFVQFCVVTPIQQGLAEFLDGVPEHYLGLPAFYQLKRDRFLELLKDSRFRLTPSKGTYFQLADYSEISTECDVDFAKRITREAGVASIPVSVFYESPVAQRLVRFCFAKDSATLERAAEVLCRL